MLMVSLIAGIQRAADLGMVVPDSVRCLQKFDWLPSGEYIRQSAVAIAEVAPRDPRRAPQSYVGSGSKSRCDRIREYAACVPFVQWLGKVVRSSQSYLYPQNTLL